MIEKIADLIVELAKEKKSDSLVRSIYSVLREVNMAVGKRMKDILEEKRKNNAP